MTPVVYKLALATAGASVVLGQATIQVSGAQMVGTAIGLIGFLLAGLISLVGFFLTRQLNAIVDTQEKHTDTLSKQDTALAVITSDVSVLKEWKAEREEIHRQKQDEQIEKLEARLESERKRRSNG